MFKALIADRVRAADLLHPDTASVVLRGDLDDHQLVQAFAGHRVELLEHCLGIATLAVEQYDTDDGVARSGASASIVDQLRALLRGARFDPAL